MSASQSDCSLRELMHNPVAWSYPLRLAPTAWITHVPFAMVLIDVLRPRTFVELGTYYGVSFCAFCQAVESKCIHTKCYGIDKWTGDSQMGAIEVDVLRDLREYVEPLYGNFARLIQSDFREALVHFEDGSIDLLHIDGFHTYDAVKKDFESWRPKLSSRGVVLLHDTNVRERDFGVWKYWNELKQQYRCFEFTHGHGLGVLLTGSECPDALRCLMDAPEATQSMVQKYFYRLGNGIESHQRAVLLEKTVLHQTNDIRTLLERQKHWTIRIILALLTYGPIEFALHGLAKIRNLRS